MKSTDYPLSATDKLPCRRSGSWAREKLQYLGRYMSIFNTAMKGKWRRAYLDLMAGPGRCVDDEGEFSGSPILSLDQKYPFNDHVFVEGDELLSDALLRRTAGRGTIIAADCNSTDVIRTMRDRLGPSVLGLAFVDNLGMEVTLDTLAALTRERRVDLLITYQVGDLKRNIRQALAGEQSPERWDAFFGPGWRDVGDRAVTRNLSADEIATELLDYYGTQLERLGYQGIAHSQRLMKNSRNVGLYRLILASKHPLGKKFFEQISSIEPGGQRRLL